MNAVQRKQYISVQIMYGLFYVWLSWVQIIVYKIALPFDEGYYKMASGLNE